MESRPVYDESTVMMKMNGVPYFHKVLHFNCTVLPLILAALTSPEEWSEIDFGQCIVLIGPAFGSAVDMLRNWNAQLPLRFPPPKDRF